MPNQEIMREWVRRLRSGDYQQGSGMLHVDDTYCCLGVLCEMAHEEGAVGDHVFRSPALLSSSPFALAPAAGPMVGVHVYNGSTAMPPPEVYDWAGFSRSMLGEFIGGAPLSVNALAGMNDKGVPFAEIADRIEAEWIKPEIPAVTVPDSPADIVAADLVNA